MNHRPSKRYERTKKTKRRTIVSVFLAKFLCFKVKPVARKAYLKKRTRLIRNKLDIDRNDGKARKETKHACQSHLVTRTEILTIGRDIGVDRKRVAAKSLVETNTVLSMSDDL